jgi:hypothetical protein
VGKTGIAKGERLPDINLKNLGKHIEALQRTEAVTGPIPTDGFENEHVFAAANDILGVGREEFNNTDDWDLMAMLERRKPSKSTVVIVESRKDAWARARRIGITRKQIGVDAFPDLSRHEEAFKKWLSGKAYPEGSDGDVAIRRTINRLTKSEDL